MPRCWKSSSSPGPRWCAREGPKAAPGGPGRRAQTEPGGMPGGGWPAVEGVWRAAVIRPAAPARSGGTGYEPSRACPARPIRARAAAAARAVRPRRRARRRAIRARAAGGGPGHRRRPPNARCRERRRGPDPRGCPGRPGGGPRAAALGARSRSASSRSFEPRRAGGDEASRGYSRRVPRGQPVPRPARRSAPAPARGARRMTPPPSFSASAASRSCACARGRLLAFDGAQRAVAGGELGALRPSR